MGTHPIFESDFDCLTERRTVNRMLREVCRRHSLIRRQSALSAKESARVEQLYNGILPEIGLL